MTSPAPPDDPFALAPLFTAGGEPWLAALKALIERQPDVATFIGPHRDKSLVPVRELTFQALKAHPPAGWRVIIFGQNPYPRVESATGIAMFDNAFADWEDARFGRVTSMRCIVKAACMQKHGLDKSASTADIRRLLADTRAVQPPEWFQAMLAQGVLLLNASLTASTGGALSVAQHTSFWRPIVHAIVDEVLRAKAATGEGIVFAWWGSHAKALRKAVEVLSANHPSVRVMHVDHCNPAAMGDAFCDGDHFGAINGAVSSLGMRPIDWLPSVGWHQGHDQAEAQRLSDFIDRTRELHRQYLERLQGVGEEALAELPAIRGLTDRPPVSLGAALAPLVARFPALSFYERHGRAFAERVRPNAPHLSEHEIAALFLYTTESVLYKELNASLRDPDRGRASAWLGYLQLLLSATAKLPRYGERLYRGVAKDLRHEYPVGRTITWWGVSSCTSNAAVAHGFLRGAKSGRRMLFEVAPRSAVSIRPFSAFQGEDEYVLAPGTRLTVTAVTNHPDGLSHVQLEEREGERLVS